MSFKTAIVLAAGPGTRMQPLTNYYPKALVPVQGKPLVSYAINMLKKNGVFDIYLTYGHKGETLFSQLGKEISGFINTTGQDNAGIFSNSLVTSLDEPIIVCPCDMIAEIDFAQLYEDYLFLGSPAACIVPVEVGTLVNADSIKLDGQKIVSISRDKSTTLYASGIQVLNPSEVLKVSKGGANFYNVWQDLIDAGKLYCSNVQPSAWKVFDTLSDILEEHAVEFKLTDPKI